MRSFALLLLSALSASAQQLPQDFCGKYVAMGSPYSSNDATEIHMGLKSFAFWYRYGAVADQHPPAAPYKSLPYSSETTGNYSACISARSSSGFSLNQPGYYVAIPNMPVNFTGLVNVTFWAEESGGYGCSPNDVFTRPQYTGVFNRTSTVCYNSAVSAAVGLPALALLLVAAWKALVQ